MPTQPVYCFGGTPHLCFGGDYYVVYSAPNEVKDIAVAMTNVSKDWMKGRYWNLPPDYDCEKSDDDFDYTWEYLVYLQEFFHKAAQANRSVIFTVSQ